MYIFTHSITINNMLAHFSVNVILIVSVKWLYISEAGLVMGVIHMRACHCDVPLCFIALCFTVECKGDTRSAITTLWTISELQKAPSEMSAKLNQTFVISYCAHCTFIARSLHSFFSLSFSQQCTLASMQWADACGTPA